MSNKRKVTQFLHFKSKSPLCRFPDTYEESAFDANWSGSPERSVRKWKYPHRGIHIKNVLTVTLYCPGIVFLNIKKKSKKKLVH